MKIDKNKKVSAIEVKPDRKISELLELMENTGFQGKNLAKSVSVYEKMIKNPRCYYPFWICSLFINYWTMENY